MASPLGPGVSEKRCRKCGLELSSRPRVKDSHGRYYCKPCYDAARILRQQKEAASRERSEPSVEVLASDTDLSRFDGLLDGGSSAALPTPVTCPSCGRGLATDAVLCTACGFDRRTGQRIGVASAPPTEPQRVVSARVASTRRSSAALESDVPFWRTAWFFGLVSLAFFGVFYGAAQASTGLAIAYQAVQIIYSLVVTLWIVVLAFQDGIAQGLLSLLCGPYTLYYGFAKVESAHLKFALGVSIIASVLGALLGATTMIRVFGQQAGAAS